MVRKIATGSVMGLVLAWRFFHLNSMLKNKITTIVFQLEKQFRATYYIVSFTDIFIRKRIEYFLSSST